MAAILNTNEQIARHFDWKKWLDDKLKISGLANRIESSINDLFALSDAVLNERAENDFQIQSKFKRKQFVKAIRALAKERGKKEGLVRIAMKGVMNRREKVNEVDRSEEEERLIGELDGAIEDMGKLVKGWENLKKRCKKRSENTARTKRLVRAYFNQLIDAANKRCQEIIDEIDEREKQFDDTVDHSLSESKHICTSMKWSKTESKKMMDDPSISDMGRRKTKKDAVKCFLNEFKEKANVLETNLERYRGQSTQELISFSIDFNSIKNAISEWKQINPYFRPVSVRGIMIKRDTITHTSATVVWNWSFDDRDIDSELEEKCDFEENETENESEFQVSLRDTVEEKEFVVDGIVKKIQNDIYLLTMDLSGLKEACIYSVRVRGRGTIKGVDLNENGSGPSLWGPWSPSIEFQTKKKQIEESFNPKMIGRDVTLHVRTCTIEKSCGNGHAMAFGSRPIYIGGRGHLIHEWSFQIVKRRFRGIWSQSIGLIPQSEAMTRVNTYATGYGWIVSAPALVNPNNPGIFLPDDDSLSMYRCRELIDEDGCYYKMIVDADKKEMSFFLNGQPVSKEPAYKNIPEGFYLMGVGVFAKGDAIRLLRYCVYQTEWE